jgi:hypothetical protein
MTDILPTGFIFHQSNLQAFQNCRFSFLLRYVKKWPWPPPLPARTSTFEQDLIAGSTLHSLIHQYFLGIEPELLVSCAADYPDARVSVWFENFLRSPYARFTGNQFPEHSLQITLDGNLLLAKFDLLRLEADMIQICDWKSSRVMPKRQFLQDRIQTMVYSLVAARAHPLPPRTISMHYWEAGFPDQPIIFEIKNAQLLGYQETITELINCIRSLSVEQFECTTNLKKCAYCEYQSYCARSGSPGDEESFHDWFEIGLSELQEQNLEPTRF